MRPDPSLNRRELLGTLAASALWLPGQARAAAQGGYQIATFEADVTPPIGHPLMGGGIADAKEIVDRLGIRGLLILGDDKPIVIASIDWCEIRNDAFDAWRDSLATAVATDPVRVLLTCIHQHDTPIADLEAQRLLELAKAKGRVCDLAFHAQAVKTAAQALRKAIPTAQPITHIGTGRAKVENVASNRRYLDPSGKPLFGRTSASRDPYAREQPEGLVDPTLRSLSFWNEEKPVAVIHSYATHPMSYYGKGGVSDDFIGLAVRNRRRSNPNLFTMYVSGCSGNVTAGKYNDGATENRARLAGRIEAAMEASFKSTTKYPLTDINFRSADLQLDRRFGAGFSVEELDQKLKTGPRPFDQCLAALGLSRLIHLGVDPTIDVPCVDFGQAQYLVLPGESYVEYQIVAQNLRPDDLVMVAGYGECSTGYVPTDKAFLENDSNLRDWCWVAPGSEARMVAAIRNVLSRR